ncbi:hypothetical protein [Streptomyces sp. NPDC050738]|uniref:hypothetical protein n=1 Tax=Streptomyces sp. NPDC050738 TaxID=3154744 RepID=UPI00342048D6
MPRTGTTRRRALIVTGAGLLAAGCSSEKPARTAPKAAPAADPETVLRNRSAATSRTLLGSYDAVLARHPATALLLRPLRDAVAAHVKALAPAAARSAAPSASPAPSAPTVPADRAAAVKALVAAERRTADAHSASLEGAPPELARLLASVAAAGAVHAYLLTEGNR